MFPQVVYSSDLQPGNPATLDLNSGTLFINKSMWESMGFDKRKNVLLHELGHYKLQTECEFEADNFAFENYIAFGGSPKQSILAISETLTADSPEQIQRLENRIKMAQEVDGMMNTRMVNFDGSVVDPRDPSGNTVLVTPEVFDGMVADIEQEEAQLAIEDAEISNEIAEEDSFLAATYYSIDEKVVLIEQFRRDIATAQKNCEDYKRARKAADCKREFSVAILQYQSDLAGVESELSFLLSKRDQRYQIKQQKVARKTQVKQARQEKRRLLAEARVYKKITRADGKQFKMMSNALTAQILATQGIDQKGGLFATGMGALTGLADSITGIWAPTTEGGTSPMNQPALPSNMQSGTSNNMIYIMIAVVVVIIVLMLVMKRK